MARARRCASAAAGAMATVAGVAVLVVQFGHARVEAHSSLAAASPAPGAVVGGDIATVQLIYTERITGFDGSITTRDGANLDSDAALFSPTEGRIELAFPLPEPGEYVVRHEVVADDGELDFGAYLFTFDPSAPAPELLDAPPVDDGGTRLGWLLAGLGLVGLGVAMSVWRVGQSVGMRRDPTSQPPPEPA